LGTLWPKVVHVHFVSIFRTNIPKEIMPFPDFPFHETEASFVHHTDVLRYLKEYAQHYGLNEHIKVRHNSLHISLLKLLVPRPASLNHMHQFANRKMVKEVLPALN
jgi:hypothetical protein